MTRLQRTLAALAALSAITAGPAGGADESATGAGLQAPAEVYEFVTAIAAPTAQARIGGDDQKVVKVTTFGRNAKGNLVVISIGVIAEGEPAQVAAGAAALMINHHQGQCGAPYGPDNYAAAQGVATFVVSGSGKRIWEFGTPEGVLSVRLVKGQDSFGPWERFQKDPAGYVTYKCAKYR